MNEEMKNEVVEQVAENIQAPKNHSGLWIGISTLVGLGVAAGATFIVHVVKKKIEKNRTIEVKDKEETADTEESEE